MLNRRMTALLLAGALALGLCGGAVLAADPGPGDESAPSDALTAVQEQNPGQAQAPGPEQSLASNETPDGPDAGQSAQDGTEPETQPAPDPEGVLSFANVGPRVREGSLNYLILEESIAQLEAYDFDKMQEDLRKALNGIANAQWQMHSVGSMLPPTSNPAVDAALQAVAGMSTSAASQSLQAQYDSLRDQFDDLKDGKIQEDMADAVRQLRNTQNSLIKTMEGVYIQLSEGDAGQATLDRALATLDRSIREVELRYELGQVSALTVQQLKASRDSLASQRESVSVSLETGRMNLENQLGAELTGSLRLSALPKVTGAQLSAMDLEADMEAAGQASYDLFAAKKALDDAQEDFKDAGKDYNYNEKKYQYVQAQHAWQAAQYTYDAAVQNFELSFRTLYAQVKDYQQVLAAAKTALAVEQDNYAVDQLKYEQGTISKNALLTAQDDLDAARDTVASAERNLFTAYNNYRWAVDYGILN